MSLNFPPVARRSTVDHVVERIQDVILENKLGAGERLPGELVLVEQLQVSRSVLREALARLQGLGLIEIQRGNGTFVAGKDKLAHCVQLLRSAVTLSPRELMSYTELRAAIEVQAVRQAAENATPTQIQELRQLLVDLNSLDLTYAEILEIDFQFHRKILEISGNVLMQNLMEVIYEFVVTQMTRTTSSPQRNQIGQRQHQEILDAIARHDPAAAERAMREHMQTILDRLKRQAEGLPAIGESEVLNSDTSGPRPAATLTTDT